MTRSLKNITSRLVYTGTELLEDCTIQFDERVVDLCGPGNPQPSLDEHIVFDGIVAPGFVDVQVNGGGDVLFNNEPTVDAIHQIVNAHHSVGATTIFPTIISDSIAVMRRARAAVSQYISQGNGVGGIHFEGPCFSKSRKGAHKADMVRSLGTEEMNVLLGDGPGVTLTTLAPDVATIEEIALLCGENVVVAIGHSDATYEQAAKAVHYGASGFTHTFNAMSGISGRAPGVATAALDSPDTWCSFIADGHHVHPALLRLATCLKPNRVFLVSDAMPVVGGWLDEFELYGESLKTDGAVLRNADGRLAGSAIGMAEAVQYIHRNCSVPLEQALAMATRIPAEFVGLGESTGHLRINDRADFVLLTETLEVHSTWVAGKQEYVNEHSCH